MACGATLKRTLEFDPLLSQASPKRRRCAPLSAPSAAAAAAASSPQKSLRLEPSPFGDVASRLTAEQILYSIKQEHKRMQKRKHLESTFQQTDPCCLNDAQPHAFLLSGSAVPGEARTAKGKMPVPCDPATAEIPNRMIRYLICLITNIAIAATATEKRAPLFTLRQVGMICERLLKECEERVREEYEEILNTKLSEQYDAFVKFTHDQIMRRYGEQPASYVS
uniref:Akirin-2 n=1 Tax=Geotrypetes seraphini TaxID=260995 RepID=A0A6P8Q7H6_GEOSA|nr:akirin-2-like [Geotrypetes seraphini]